MKRAPGRWSAALPLLLAAGACLAPSGPERVEVPPGAEPRYTEDRAPCLKRNPFRDVYFGDLHVHTSLSFDARAYGTVATPEDAFAFAAGEPLDIPGEGGRVARLSRPLDFVAVSDHGEYLGEVRRCLDEDSNAFDLPTCREWRETGEAGVVAFGLRLAAKEPVRMADVCDPAPDGCLEDAREVWKALVRAADAAYDRTGACRLTTFPAYEYTDSEDVTNLHRYVVFRNSVVPDLPVTYFEADPIDLLRHLASDCLDAGSGCDAISVPHNSNWSNGRLYEPAYPGAAGIEDEREVAALRARIEPVAEVFQHKGDMECDPYFAEAAGAPDPECDFEKQRFLPFEDCGDGTGFGGVSRLGCQSRRDFLRGVLDAGLSELARIGENPFRFGVIGGTDTHNATPGFVLETAFEGHVGTTDDTAAERLGPGNMTHHGVVHNPGGLAAVWAVENSRDAIFEAVRRREVYATSGPRIEVRFFAGFDLPPDLCQDRERVRTGYARGVPMGADLPSSPPEGLAPSFVAWATADPGAAGAERVPLERIQIVTGALRPDGTVRERVIDLAVASGDASVDLHTCERTGGGAETLCGRWVDGEFDPSRPAYWYARVLEVPTCRWSVRQCLALAEGERPSSCTDPRFNRAIRERAWTSPVFFTPAGIR